MDESKISEIFALNNALITAPAGHGKTEMIADMVEYADGKQLVLTHTNAGVNAISGRIKKRGIDMKKCEITTIASYCAKWCSAYPVDTKTDDLLWKDRRGIKDFYQRLYSGTKKLFTHEWAKKVLQASYSGIIVDEYQDCQKTQHDIFVTMNTCLPVRALGDPMQGIFSFGGDLVKWDEIPFQEVKIDTKPWRWLSTNPELGYALMELREDLTSVLSGKAKVIDLTSYGDSIEVLSPEDINPRYIMERAKNFENLVYLTQWPSQQLEVSKKMPGFQHDEKQDLDELFLFAERFDETDEGELMLSFINFVSTCATVVGAELDTYKKHLSSGDFDFGRITKNVEFGSLLLSLRGAKKTDVLLKMMEWMWAWPVFRRHLYRKELFIVMGKSVRMAKNTGCSILNAAEQIRANPRYDSKESNARFLSSRTLLSKGLEFDCVILDLTSWQGIDVRNFYVALTRARKKVFIISNKTDVIFAV